MTIEFRCEQCGKLLRTADDKAGLQARCPGCGTEITVPALALEGGVPLETTQHVDAAVEVPMKRCPVCGESIRAEAIKCRYCGEDLSGGRGPAVSGFLKPHRGGVILTLGIVSIFCCGIVLGPIAWIMANRDLGEMDAGIMDSSGAGLTQAGKICGIVGLVLVVVTLVAQILIIIFGAVAHGAAL